MYDSQENLDEEPDDRQISNVWKIKVNPIARGCRNRVNKSDVAISIIEVRTSIVISESSLIKILVLGIGDRVNSLFLTL